ncbi:murein L,D-transpeptidase [bacterium]|nr:murein L,D-transpeptidase [bacterium]
MQITGSRTTSFAAPYAKVSTRMRWEGKDEVVLTQPDQLTLIPRPAVARPPVSVARMTVMASAVAGLLPFMGATAVKADPIADLINFTLKDSQPASPKVNYLVIHDIQSVDLHKDPLKLGYRGEPIARLQKGLSLLYPLKVTGTFDTDTQAVVKQFQKENDLPQSGEVGRFTYGQLWNKLFWEKNLPLDLNGPEFYRNAPKHVRLEADLGRQQVRLINADTGQTYKAYPFSSGSEEFPTPKMDFKITHVDEKPTWNPPPSSWARNAKPVGPGPKNPLGPVRMRLNGSAVLFHGVPRHEWSGIGKQAESHGCMRMLPFDAWELHKLVPVGTQGTVR